SLRKWAPVATAPGSDFMLAPNCFQSQKFSFIRKSQTRCNTRLESNQLIVGPRSISSKCCAKHTANAFSPFANVCLLLIFFDAYRSAGAPKSRCAAQRKFVQDSLSFLFTDVATRRSHSREQIDRKSSLRAHRS